MKKCCIACALIGACLLSGCNTSNIIQTKKEVESKMPIEYTVVEDADVPTEFLEAINGKKKEKFKLTFSDKENLYIAMGYGEQPTSGYCISIDEIYQTSDSIEINLCFDGPDRNEETVAACTYPYIVIKVECTDKMVNIY